MRRFRWIGTSIVLAVAFLASGVVLGQGMIGGRLVQPVRLVVERSASALAEVAVMVDGVPVTASVPLSVNVAMVVDVVGGDATSAPASVGRTVTLSESVGLLPSLAEMPTGFYLDGEASALSSNDQVAEGFADTDAAMAMLEEVGRLGGWSSRFRNTQFTLFGGGNANIDVSVLVFADPEGAQRYVDEAPLRVGRRAVVKGKPVTISAPILGDGSVLFKVDVTEDESTRSEYEMWVRRGNVVLVIEGKAMQNMGNVDQLLEVAQRILDRME